MEKSLRIQSVKRNIIFWGTLAEQIMLMILGISVFYIIIFGMGEQSIEGIFLSALFYIGVLGAVFILIAQISYASSYIPLAISFGAKRSETVWGVQLLNLLLMLQLILLFGIVAGLAEMLPVIGWMGVCAFALLMIFCAAMGQFWVIVSIRFKTKGVLLFAVLASAAAVTVSIFLVAGPLSGNGFGGKFGEMVNSFLDAGVDVLIAYGAVVVFSIYAVSLLLYRKVIQKYEVCR